MKIYILLLMVCFFTSIFFCNSQGDAPTAGISEKTKESKALTNTISIDLGDGRKKITESIFIDGRKILVRKDQDGDGKDDLFLIVLDQGIRIHIEKSKGGKWQVFEHSVPEF